MLDTLLGLLITRAPVYALRRLAQSAARWKLRRR